MTLGRPLGLTACGADTDSASDTSGPLVVAASPTPHAEILDFVKDNLAKDAGLELEVKEFTDYVTPNTATEDGSVDANYFQNQPYLDDFNKKNGTHIVPVVTVHPEPLGLYSNKVKSADALKLLDASGIITLKDGVGTEATPADITENPKKLQFKELEAAQTPRSLDDVDAAVTNGNYALEPTSRPPTTPSPSSPPRTNPNGNLLAVEEGDEDDPRVEKLAELLTSDGVRKFIEEKWSNGSVIPSF